MNIIIIAKGNNPPNIIIAKGNNLSPHPLPAFLGGRGVLKRKCFEMSDASFVVN